MMGINVHTSPSTYLMSQPEYFSTQHREVISCAAAYD